MWDNFEDFTNSENPVFSLRLADKADKGVPLVNMKTFKKNSFSHLSDDGQLVKYDNAKK